MLKALIAILSVIVLGLQYRLWVGDGSMAHWVAIKRDIVEQKQEVEAIKERNRVLLAEVIALKNGNDLIEEKARTQLGMIREGETFYMFSREPR